MKPDLVTDVGNTRVKWGLCAGGRVTETASLPPDDPAAWQARAAAWGLRPGSRCVVTGVHPARRDRLRDWLAGQGHDALLLDAPESLPLRVLLERPDHVGVDRLLNAVAANTRRRPGIPAVLIDAGSAVTVDYVDGDGAFRGGAIFPGLRLMAQSLHEYTALLPLIRVETPAPALGRNTREAMHVGIFWAVAGGIRALVEQHREAAGEPEVFLTGGNGELLASRLPAHYQLWPEMTLEGVRISAEALP